MTDDSMEYEYDDSSHVSTPAQQIVDMGYGYAVPIQREEPVDMGYGDATPSGRRGSMTVAEEKERRASIKAIMADPSLGPMEKRRSIQHLMDGRRSSIGAGSQHSSTGSVGSLGGNSMGYEDMGYGDTNGVIKAETEEIRPRSDEETRRLEISRPHCSHYERNCTIIAPCCGAAFGCRICHDDCPVLPPKIERTPSSRRVHRTASLPSSFTSMPAQHIPEDNHHQIDRFAIKEVICRECFTRQSSKTNFCINCEMPFGEYHCNICNLWMSADEQPYHCAECGFCRVGGAENFQHCNDCGMCIDRSLYNTHNCKAGKYKSNCPVCQEYLFSSRSASHEMPCGHAIHWECFRQLAAHDSRCPVCKKTAETRERMMPTWTAMAQSVALQPVPPELARVVNITCNDCEINAHALAWHFLGVQCNNCQSFNTVVDEIVLSGEEAHEFLEMQAFRQAINEARANGEQTPRRRVNRRRSAI
ncbi:RING finger and CHY zinc finger domain-containing protein 1 [Fistulifera solaris]|uniref:RING finger and CHY zinc finger domain-containing protein 1 n=1 Tax=Fistulifera solaris TaxID=1519565 RepID=A0A1Z5JHV2_FISSO|nr:RING finger and CHY zinc finger domain-containing protein 1 [Fistulifera solaris]|eukprot:GAX13580.1 RING finger and CHY zinc finger domain-containing protein 1 [Fistulifera solaris]